MIWRFRKRPGMKNVFRSKTAPLRTEMDLDEALTRLKAQAPLTANRWYIRLLAAVQTLDQITLETMPERCPRTGWRSQFGHRTA